MTVASTSLTAFTTVNVTERQNEVLLALYRLMQATDVQIGAALGWTINRVTPRRGELKDMGLVEFVRTTIGPTGRPMKVWKLTDGARAYIERHMDHKEAA